MATIRKNFEKEENPVVVTEYSPKGSLGRKDKDYQIQKGTAQ